MSETTDIEQRLVAALWQTVAARGWEGVTMRRIAAASGVAPAAIRRLCPGPGHLLALHERVMDQAVLEGTVPGQGGLPRDRLFDVLMRRIDAMQPHRAGIVRLLRDLPREPLVAARLLGGLGRSMAWMLEAAEIDPRGLAGLARVEGTVAIWLAVVRAWMGDPSMDLGPTMAALDRALDRAEQVARSFGIGPGDLGQAPPDRGALALQP